MTNPFDDETLTFRVVVNDEDQHAIWPDFKEIPKGWHEAGCRGSRADCMAFIEDNWTDMRPASLRRAMEGEAG